MTASFFPDPLFAWVFCLALVGLLATASFTDFRTFLVPKWVSLSCLALGVLFNVVRGAWLGSDGTRVWLFAEPTLTLGALDGLLFALFGALVGFGIFFGLWVLGGCGGGDVKLFAALASWVGAYYAIWIMAFSTAILLVLSVVILIVRSAQKGGVKAMREHSLQQGVKGKDGKRPRSRLMTYSFPLAVATSLVLLWCFRVDLQLADPPPHRAPAAPTSGQ